MVRHHALLYGFHTLPNLLKQIWERMEVEFSHSLHYANLIVLLSQLLKV